MNLMKLDSLMGIVDEVVITESVVIPTPRPQLLPRDDFDNFMKSDRQLHRLTDGLQDIATLLHMVSISGVFQKMNYIIRSMSQKLNKDTRLTIIGEDTEVDKTIMDSIQDPIIHLVKDSMDHGIEETTQEHIDAGKESQGEITLSAPHTSSEVIISTSDDGYGISPSKLLTKVREKGLLTRPKSKYSRKEALGLIMLPGLSTNQVVTEYPSRGVGTGVVEENVESVGDTISISSEDGKGITVTMNIPLALAIMGSMKVAVGDSIFTTPISNTHQFFKVSVGRTVLGEYGGEMAKRMEHFYPVIHLHSSYNLEAEITSIEDGILMWVEASDRSCCLFVDDLAREQQVVVKPLPVFLNSFNLKNDGITGCTILGDENINITLDTAGSYIATIENV